ncbi:MAG: hypothetical protein EOM11_09410 [Erysipelotrichia bacterium]|nr:hypothetical protein [Erysipelotrichia bacterium]
MDIYIRNLEAGLGVFGFYELLYRDEKYLLKLKNMAYDVLVRYGKVATKNSQSIANINNMYLSTSINNNSLEVDFHWGKTDSDIVRFNQRIHDMTYGTSNVPTLAELTNWVRLKEVFFQENPFMLKNGSSFFNRDVVRDELEYAKMLQQKLEEAQSFSFGNRVFRGQSKYAFSGDVGDEMNGDPIMPEYSHKSKHFIDAINQKIEKDMKERYESITQAIIDRVLAQNVGGTEYIVAIDDALTVNMVESRLMPEIIVDIIRNEGQITIDYNEAENKETDISFELYKKIDRASNSLINKVNRNIERDMKGNKAIDVNRYADMINNTASKFKIKNK